jgi:hypothetical protein
MTLLLLPLILAQQAPVPDAEAQRKAENVIREVFGADYARKMPAKKLLQQGLETRDDPASQYVLLREARDLAARAGDVATAYQAIDEMARRFEGDVAGAKAGALALIVAEVRPSETFKLAAEAYLKLADETAAAGDFETAEKTAAAAAATARRAKDVSLVGRAEAKSREVIEVKARLARVKKAIETLAAKPEDAAANLEVGQYECFIKGSWETGLPMLAKGSDEALRSLAQKDLAGAGSSQERTALADGWWTRGEKERGVARQRIRDRAAHWYALAAADATGLTKMKIDRRLEELGRPAVVGLPIAGDAGLLGWWKLDEGSGTKLVDSSGRGAHGSLSKDGEWTEDRKGGKALWFRGRQWQAVIPDSEALRLTGDMTVALWVRLEARSPDWVQLIGKGTQVSRNYGLWLEKDPGKRILFQQGDGTPNHINAFASTTSTLDAWTHLAGVVQGSSVSVYVNGRRESTSVRNVVPPTSREPLVLGYAGYHEALVGVLDDIRLYNRALSDKEIEQLAAP